MFGRPHNPEYARERLPLEGPRAGNPQGLRDAHWVVFSAARSQRPGASRNPKDATAKESCPFCEGHETITPPEVPHVPRPRATRRTGLVDPLRPQQIPRTRTGRRGPRASGRAVPERRRRRGARDRGRIPGPLRLTSRRWTIARLNWCSGHIASGITTSLRTVGSSMSRSSRTMANEPARPTLTRTSDHRDPDRAPPDSRREGGHACARRAAGGRVLVLRNPPTRAGLRTARRRRERRVRRARP